MTVFVHYTQSTGRFALGELKSENLLFSAFGHAGNGPGKNNPDMQSVPNVGPLPVGEYMICRAAKHRRLGPVSMRLEPDPKNRMFGRSGFYIHGDCARDPGECSHGCIILPRHVREAVARYVPCLLVVRP